MSKWIDKDLFSKFVEQKKNEKDNVKKDYIKRAAVAWKRPEKGTESKAKIYVGRFLPDPKGQFYKEYHYHMFKVGEQWQFFLCPKTYGFDRYCPWCSISSKLYTGTKADKDMGYNMKRKSNFVSNWFVVDDPRDNETENEEAKVIGKVKIYEFPSKVEKKLKEQITDPKNGLGNAIFEPGKGGFDFVLKVTSTKKDDRGREFPDYSLSEFGRKPHPIAESEKEIEAIMAQRIDLEEYISNMERDEEVVINTLKQMMLWDLVRPEWEKEKGTAEVSTGTVDIAVEDDIPDFSKKGVEDEDIPPFETGDNEDLTDAQLLKELEDL